SLACGIAPSALGIPMPGLHKQIGVLPVTDDSPPGGQDLLDLVGPKKHVGGIAGHTIHGRAQCIEGTECVYDMAGRCIDNNGLPHATSWRDTQKNDCV